LAIVNFVGGSYFASASKSVGFTLIDKPSVSTGQEHQGCVQNSPQYTVPHPSNLVLVKPAGAIVITGFTFSPGANIRVQTSVNSADSNGVTVTAGTWCDSLMTAIAVTVIHYDAAQSQLGFGQFNWGVQSKSGQVALPTGTRGHFIGLTHIDFTNGYNYRVTQTWTHPREGGDVTTTAPGDTQCVEVFDSVFYYA